MKDWNEMTEEEADMLDEYYSTHPVKAGPNLMKQGMKPGFTHDPGRVVTLDALSATYISARAEAEHHTPAEVVAEMVRREMALAA
jgi:hypothetical protein